MAIYDPKNRPAAAYDTHAHLNEDNFWHDVPAYWARAQEFQINEVNVVGYDQVGNERALAIAHEFENVHAIIGFQPEDVASMTDEAFAQLEEEAQDPEVVGLGEMGLDYHWPDNPSSTVQKAALNRQLELARELHLPVTIHSRDAFEDTYELLAANSIDQFGGVMHSFSGGPADVKPFLDLGMYIGFSGMVTFKKASEIREALKIVPLDRILVETDAPFLAPTPMRGKQNEPMYVRYTVQKIADILGLSYDELANITTENAHRLWLNK